jgi:hypothetical protein
LLEATRQKDEEYIKILLRNGAEFGKRLRKEIKELPIWKEDKNLRKFLKPLFRSFEIL